VGIVGAAGNIGSIYARLIAEQVPAMVLVGRERSAHRLRDLAKEILVEAFAEKDSDAGISRQLHAAPWFEEVPERFEKGESLGEWLLNQQSDPEGSSPLITVTTDLKRLAECDVILCTSSSAQPLVLPEHLKQGPLVICDLAVPGDVDPSVHQSCPEASVISGGILSLTHNPQLSYLGSPLAPGHIFACMGETLLMGLDGHQDHLSIGDIHKYQVKRIRDSAERHGFEVILPVDYSGRLL
jgi:predicted amino acid dehydrogenase